MLWGIGSDWGLYINLLRMIKVMRYCLIVPTNLNPGRHLSHYFNSLSRLSVNASLMDAAATSLALDCAVM